MKRGSTGVLTIALLAILIVHASSVLAATAPAGVQSANEVPILFNDRHVYARDRLRAGRVLAALVRGKTVLVPLRSIFEQMGAAVTFDERAKRVDVDKPGSDVKVTLGIREVIINGETRPLDVAPEMYRGSLLVPLRVISEGMGAYVAWSAKERTVVVRYLAAPVATPPPAVPTAVPTAVPVPPTARRPAPGRPVPAKRNERFIVGDYIVSPASYNEINAGAASKPSFRAAAAFEFPLFNLPWMIEGDLRSFRYRHGGGDPVTACNAATAGNPGCVNGSGKQGLVYLPAFDARDDDFDTRFALRIANPRIYIGIGYEFRNTNYEGGALPTQEHGLGVGLEKLPDLDQSFSLYGSMFYYPSLTTDATQNLGDGSFGEVQYRYLKYNVGLTLDLGHSPLFFQGGYLGDRGYDKQNAPSDFSHDGAYAGLGVHF